MTKFSAMNNLLPTITVLEDIILLILFYELYIDFICFFEFSFF